MDKAQFILDVLAYNQNRIVPIADEAYKHSIVIEDNKITNLMNSLMDDNDITTALYLARKDFINRVITFQQDNLN